MPAEQQPNSIEVNTRVERKQPDLPRYAIIPANALQPWDLSGTTVVEVALNGMPVNRRSLKRWDEERWFVSITAKDCDRIGADTGDEVHITLTVASTDLPAELEGLIRNQPRARTAWQRMTPSQQRMLRENVGMAKEPETRDRRARRALLGPESAGLG
ncbi:MAG: hypothetical protein GF320_01480 [Armatimonadia bacterium]|nr:hypothetical protein [Armatimonadia bacterium]